MEAVSVSATRQSLRVTLPATLAHIEDACDAAREHLERYGAAEDSFCLLLGLRETLTNAVLHGSGQDPRKTVTMDIVVHPTNVIIAVEDQGQGFNWREHSLEPPNPDATGGRGLPILQSCFDTIEFNDRGNRIRLAKHLRRDALMSEITREGETARLAPQRDIVAAMVAEFKLELNELVDAGVQHLVLDFTGVEMVDSIGIGLLIATHNALKLNGGGMVLEHVSPDIASLFRTMRLDKHFEIVTS